MLLLLPFSFQVLLSLQLLFLLLLLLLPPAVPLQKHCLRRVLTFSRCSLLTRDVSSLDHLWTSSVHFMSRTSSAALVAAHRVLQRFFAFRTCSPPSTRIHQDLLHHTMFALGTSFFLFSRMVTSSSLFRFLGTSHFSPSADTEDCRIRSRVPPLPHALLALSLLFMRFSRSLFLLTLLFGRHWPSFFPTFPPGVLTQLFLFLHLGFTLDVLLLLSRCLWYCYTWRLLVVLSLFLIVLLLLLMLLTSFHFFFFYLEGRIRMPTTHQSRHKHGQTTTASHQPSPRGLMAAHP